MMKRLAEIGVPAFDGCLGSGVLGLEDMLTLARKSRGQGETSLENQSRRAGLVIMRE